MLNLRIERGPLPAIESETILGEYNRLTSSRIPIEEFVHWVQDGPAGPAWHAILQNDDGQLVGHTSFIPLCRNGNGKYSIPAKSEYTFLREEYRAEKIRGFEQSGKPTWLIFADQLHRHCVSLGWGPLFVSTTPTLHRFFASIGCRRADFPLWECLLVLRPRCAARDTPNLHSWQRASLLAAGMVQSTMWSGFSRFLPQQPGMASMPIDGELLSSSGDASTFFSDEDFLRWRYLNGQYERIAVDKTGHEYVIVKKGSADRYLRVCQWQLDSGLPNLSVINRLVQMAKGERALGVRWAFYGNGMAAKDFVSRTRKFGFLCTPRVRTLLIYPKEQFQVAEKWRLTDAMFSFDP